MYRIELQRRIEALKSRQDWLRRPLSSIISYNGNVHDIVETSCILLGHRRRLEDKLDAYTLLSVASKISRSGARSVLV